MKKKPVDNVRTDSEREFRRLSQSLREQWSRMDKAQKLAEELHEEIKKVEEHVQNGKNKSRKRK